MSAPRIYVGTILSHLRTIMLRIATVRILSKLNTLSALVVAFSLGACAEQPGVPEDRRPAVRAVAAPQITRAQTYDDQLLALSANAPMFAGFVAESGGRVRALWADANQSSVASTKPTASITTEDEGAVQAFLASHKWVAGSDTHSGRTTRAVRFPAARLLQARATLDDRLSALGVLVTMSDFNESENRVDIAVASNDALILARREVAALGLPDGAVQLSVERAATQFQTLRDNVPPIRGGMGVATNFIAEYECTITPPISQYTGPYSPLYDDVVLTNSHCTTSGNSLGSKRWRLLLSAWSLHRPRDQRRSHFHRTYRRLHSSDALPIRRPCRDRGWLAIHAGRSMAAQHDSEFWRSAWPFGGAIPCHNRRPGYRGEYGCNVSSRGRRASQAGCVLGNDGWRDHAGMRHSECAAAQYRQSKRDAAEVGLSVHGQRACWQRG